MTTWQERGFARVAVVTGATGGIGQAICRRLACDGYNIIGQYRDHHDRAATLCTELNSHGNRCLMLAADLTLDSQRDHFIEQVEAQIISERASLWALVNNAAKLLGPSFDQATGRDFDDYFALNTKAPLLLSQKLARFMNGGGSIVNISSAGVHFSSPGDIVYAMSKAALESLTYHAAEALARRQIRVNAVIPGFTDNGHELFRDPQARAHMESFAILGGISSPDTVADAVSYLVSDASCRTTGSTIDVTGGSILGIRPPSGLSLKRQASKR